MEDEEKKLEAKKPTYYAVGLNMMTPFAVPEQTENKELDEDRSHEKRMRMEENRHSPEESLEGMKRKAPKDQRKE
jgi:hypothetical protein